MEYLSVHMKSVHNESDHERIERLSQTFKSVTFKEDNEEIWKVQPKSFDCVECGEIFSSREEQTIHNKNHHINSLVNKEDDNDNVCDLCDKVLPNKTQKSNHMIFQHTVNSDILQCDYCDYICSDLMKLCKHISSEHSELFPKREIMDNKCDMCYVEFATKDEVTTHMRKKTQPWKLLWKNGWRHFRRV